VVDSLRIRAARPDDVEPLTAIRREAILTLSSEEVGGVGRARDWANSATPDRVCGAIEEHQVRVAEKAGQPVGWVEVERNRIEGMYVRPNHVRRGIGSALLAHAEERIRSAGYSTAELDASWNAEQFYINRGYEPLSERLPAGRPMVKHLASDAS
jgi:GNAT superfamily N-acetyltransferase